MSGSEDSYMLQLFNDYDHNPLAVCRAIWVLREHTLHYNIIILFLHLVLLHQLVAKSPIRINECV